MPLNILLTMVVVGISAIVLILHLSGRSRTPVLSENAARQSWVRHYPDDTVHTVQIAGNGKSALVRTSAGPGVIWVFGADTVARHLKNCDVTETATGLRIDFHDYSTPRAVFALTASERADWQAEMEAA